MSCIYIFNNSNYIQIILLKILMSFRTKASQKYTLAKKITMHFMPGPTNIWCLYFLILVPKRLNKNTQYHLPQIICGDRKVSISDLRLQLVSRTVPSNATFNVRKEKYFEGQMPSKTIYVSRKFDACCSNNVLNASL